MSASILLEHEMLHFRREDTAINTSLGDLMNRAISREKSAGRVRRTAASLSYLVLPQPDLAYAVLIGPRLLSDIRNLERRDLINVMAAELHRDEHLEQYISVAQNNAPSDTTSSGPSVVLKSV